jgi:hypothetical protein
MRDVSLLIDRNKRLMRRSGYGLFANTVGRDRCRWMNEMTDADIAFWHERLDEWEALGEAEKCQYDVLAVLGQV